MVLKGLAAEILRSERSGSHFDLSTPEMTGERKAQVKTMFSQCFLQLSPWQSEARPLRVVCGGPIRRTETRIRAPVAIHRLQT